MASVVGYLVFRLANQNSWTNHTLEDMALGWLLTSAPVGARVGFGFHLADVTNDTSIGEAALEYLVDGFAMRSVGRDFVTYLRDVERTQNKGEPPACIVTGQDGENPDDCTTHDHE